MKKQKGFTLIELLVAITIMSVLVAIALVSFQGARRAARDGKRKADLEQVRSALEMRRTDCGSYPPGTIVSLGDIIGDGSSATCLLTPPSPPYITIPADPIGGDYQYCYEPGGSGYNLCARLEGDSPGATCTCDCDVAGGGCNYEVNNP